MIIVFLFRQEDFATKETIRHWQPIFIDVTAKLSLSIHRAEKWLELPVPPATPHLKPSTCEERLALLVNDDIEEVAYELENIEDEEEEEEEGNLLQDDDYDELIGRY